MPSGVDAFLMDKSDLPAGFNRLRAQGSGLRIQGSGSGTMVAPRLV